ncbi:MAG: P-loop NTPase fold protein [Solirubrobacteraceae bacterium]
MGHSGFARHLANTIAMATPSESVAIALFGQTGSGRTTVLNFVRHHLRDHGASRFTVADWNPWLTSGDDSLERRLVHLLAAAAIPPRADPHEPLDSSHIAAVRARVAAALAAGDRRLLVLVDDADRLSGHECFELLRLIAASGDMPNLVFLLALNRGAVAAALGQAGPTAVGLMDKVLQVQVDMPVPDRSGLQQLFVDRLDAVIADARADGTLDEAHWTDICVNGVDHFLRTPRDAIRLVNAVRATYPAVQGEVNPVDFVALETLRIFCPVAYEAIRRRPAAFLLPPNVLRVEGGIPELRAFHEEWMECLDATEKLVAGELLMRMFPRLPDVFGARHLASAPEGTWRRDLRLCSEDIFPVYFQLSIPDGSLSNSDTRSTLAQLSSPAEFARSLIDLTAETEADGRSRASALLERIDAEIRDGLQPSQLEGVVNALFIAGDRLSRDPHAAALVGRMLAHSLRRIDEQRRSTLLLEAIARGTAIATMVETVVMIGQEHGRYGGEWVEGAPQLVSLAALGEIENATARAVEQAAERGALLPAPRALEILERWAGWSHHACRQWVAATTADDAGLLAFLRMFLEDLGTPSASVRGPRVSFRLDPRRLQPFLDPASIVPRVRALAEQPQRTEFERQALRRYVIDHDLLSRSADPVVDLDDEAFRTVPESDLAA